MPQDQMVFVVFTVVSMFVVMAITAGVMRRTHGVIATFLTTTLCGAMWVVLLFYLMIIQMLSHA